MPIVGRNLADVALDSARHYPIVTLTGPRQSGKTTLCRSVFPNLEYVNLEPRDTRDFASDDPRGFLAAIRRGAVLDEIQHTPELLGYIQEEVDRIADPGRFVLTGSQHLGLSAAVAQSLAGRTAILYLLPMSLDELMRFPSPPGTLHEVLLEGGYPRVHDRGIPAPRWLSDYTTTYLERDVRQVLNVGDLSTFATFLRLAAGRTACELNLSALGSDAGVSHNTVKSWLSVLESTFIIHRAKAWHRNVRKQLVRSPKMYFVDSGLACHLLGIRTPEQVGTHPLRGQVFESWVAGEIMKARLHRGTDVAISHYRESRGVEIDLVIDTAEQLTLVEAKSAATIASDWFGPIQKLKEDVLSRGEMRSIRTCIVYGGDNPQTRLGVDVIPWHMVHEYDW